MPVEALVLPLPSNDLSLPSCEPRADYISSLAPLITRDLKLVGIVLYYLRDLFINNTLGYI